MNRTKQRLLVMVLRLSALIVLAVFIVVARHSLAEMWHLARFESLDNGERWGVIKFLGQHGSRRSIDRRASRGAKIGTQAPWSLTPAGR